MMILRATIILLTSVVLLIAFAVETVSCAPAPICGKMAGADAEKACKDLPITFQASSGLKINNTFSQYFPEGSMPSLEKLTALYPDGTIPPDSKVNKILQDVGPDFDIKSDAYYGRVNHKTSDNGPLGGMPAFCRFGAFIETSSLTHVLMEIWMPLASNQDVPLAPVDEPDCLTNTTGVLVNNDNAFDRAPLYFTQGLYEIPKPAIDFQRPLTPNDIPLSEKDAKSIFSSLGNKDASTVSTLPQKHSDASSKAVNAELPRKRLTKRHSVSTKEALSGEQLLGSGTGWNGRLMAIGNGGQRGFVPLADLKQVMTRYGFAVTGNNGGHFSTTAGVTWINGTQFDDTLLDWASRANHVSLELSEEVVDAFYGKTEGIRVAADGNRLRRYYSGSSVGGARGLSAMQVDPADYHGYLIGAPAIDFMDMNIGQIAIQKVHNKTYAGDGWFTQAALIGPVRDTILDQCDKLDGVEDRILSDPFSCKFTLEEALLCQGNGKYGGSDATCLTQKQIDTVYNLYKEASLDGNVVYPSYLPGLEDSAPVLKGKSLKASGYTQLVVYRQPKLDKAFNQFTDITFEALQKAKAENPGRANTDDPNLAEFVKSGAKTIVYHGLSDLVVSPRSTINYFEKAAQTTGDALHQSMKLYLVPSMLHSRNGRGAINFGGITHLDVGNRPLKFDSHHDMILAMVAWVEKEQEPQDQISATYQSKSAYLPDPVDASDGPDIDLPVNKVYQNYNWGIDNTRILCPYPSKAVYKGGPTTGEASSNSFKCV